MKYVKVKNRIDANSFCLTFLLVNKGIDFSQLSMKSRFLPYFKLPKQIQQRLLFSITIDMARSNLTLNAEPLFLNIKFEVFKQLGLLIRDFDVQNIFFNEI